MELQVLIPVILLGISILGGFATLIIHLIRGDIKNFIIEKMEEAGELYKDLPKPEKSIKKLQYVLEAVKEKYKIAELFINIKKFIEYIVQLNNKKM